jgi:hypothetical protein
VIAVFVFEYVQSRVWCNSLFVLFSLAPFLRNNKGREKDSTVSILLLYFYIISILVLHFLLSTRYNTTGSDEMTRYCVKESNENENDTPRQKPPAQKPKKLTNQIVVTLLLTFQ